MTLLQAPGCVPDSEGDYASSGGGPWTPPAATPPPLRGSSLPGWMAGSELPGPHAEAARGSVCHQVGHRHGCAVATCPRGRAGPPPRARSSPPAAISPRALWVVPARAPVCICPSSARIYRRGGTGIRGPGGRGLGRFSCKSAPTAPAGETQELPPRPPAPGYKGLAGPLEGAESWGPSGGRARRVVPERLRSPLSSQLVWAWDPLCSTCPQAPEPPGNLHPQDTGLHLRAPPGSQACVRAPRCTASFYR